MTTNTWDKFIEKKTLQDLARKAADSCRKFDVDGRQPLGGSS